MEGCLVAYGQLHAISKSTYHVDWVPVDFDCLRAGDAIKRHVTVQSLAPVNMSFPEAPGDVGLQGRADVRIPNDSSSVF